MNARVPDQAKLETFVMKALNDIAGAYGGFMVTIGAKLGLYKAMAGAGPISPRELAKRTGCNERYVREWLNSQAAGEYVAYHPASGTYELYPEQAMVLADEDSPVYMPNAWNIPAAMFLDEEKTLADFRTGKGVNWGEHTGRVFCGVAAFYRNGYRANLVPAWLPALEGVVPKLEAGISVADVGCGYGYSTVLMAKAFPKSRFYGFDAHEDSIKEARKHAAEAGVADRVTFEVARTVDYPDHQYGLVCFFDCLHDLGDPVAAAKHAGKTLAPGGTVMLVEPFAHDKVEDNHNLVGRLYFGGSTFLCCPHAMSEGGHMVLGAQAGEGQLAAVFRKAGFGHFRRATETAFNLVLEARK